MVDLRTLLERARTSEDGEAYAVVVRGPGFRIGMVARKRSRKVPIVFLEVVLDPFPERPDVDPRRMRGQGELVAALKSRGYGVNCDPDGTITFERSLPPNHVSTELRAVRRMLGCHHLSSRPEPTASGVDGRTLM